MKIVEDEIADIVLSSKTIAVVGISRNEEKAAYAVPAYLQKQGYKIIPVNPNATEILGEQTKSKLAEITEKVDIIEIFRPSDETPDIVKEAVKLQPRLIWLQFGIANTTAEKIAAEHGIPIVMNKCLKVVHYQLTKKE